MGDDSGSRRKNVDRGKKIAEFFLRVDRGKKSFSLGSDLRTPLFANCHVMVGGGILAKISDAGCLFGGKK